MIDSLPHISAGLVAGLIGLCIGSGLANIAWCWPDRLNGLWARRSACDSCGTVLGVVDLIPCLGWFIRRGRCVHCQAAIPSYYWQVECAAGLIAAIAVAVLGPFNGAILSLVGWILLLLARIDLDQLLLPNILTYSLITIALAAPLWPAWPGPSFTNAVMSAALGYGLLAGVRWAYFRYKNVEGLGLGDAKLFAASGALAGFEGLANILVLAAGSSLLIGLLNGRSMTSQKPIPFGPALAAATYLQLLFSWGRL